MELAKFENIIFVQDENAVEALNIIVNDCAETALDYLRQWHYPGEHEHRYTLDCGRDDYLMFKQGYLMSYSLRLSYIGLMFYTSYECDEMFICHNCGCQVTAEWNFSYWLTILYETDFFLCDNCFNCDPVNLTDRYIRNRKCFISPGYKAKHSTLHNLNDLCPFDPDKQIFMV